MEKHIKTPHAASITKLFNSVIERLCLAESMPHEVINNELTFDEAQLRAWKLTDAFRKAKIMQEEELEALSKF